MAKNTILVSGIQPSGRLHIGNHLGAIKNFVELQNSGKYKCFFFVADLHALTESPEPNALRKNILNLTADYLAAGLDPKKSVIFQQSQVPAHTELAWILNTITPLGELGRMTQFKDKSHGDFSGKSVNAGLFDYPVLMAADILIYDAEFVPVGHDQLQHLELARALARKFNSRFPVRRGPGESGKKTFTEPKPLLTPTPRVMSLTNPEKKMSKSEPEGCLFIDDPPEEIERKIKRAVTDSGSKVAYEPKNEKKRGINNLIEIAAALSDEKPRTAAGLPRGSTPEKTARRFAGKGYAELKKFLAVAVADCFADFRKKKSELLAKHSALESVLSAGSAGARKIADKKISEVKQRIGAAL